MFPLVAFAQHQDLKTQFLADYSDAAKKLEHFYRNLRAEAVVDDTREKKGQRHLLYKSREAFLLLEGNSRVFTLGPRNNFRLGKRSQSYFIEDLPKEAKDLELPIHANGPVFFAPYCLIDVRIVDLFEGAKPHNCVITKRVNETIAGKKMVKVYWEFRPRKQPVKPGWFLFSPDDMWAVQEFNMGTVHGLLQYEGAENAIPLLRSLQLSGKTWKQTYQITALVPGPVPEEEFTLPFYGFPEPHGTGPQPWYLWLGGIGILCLIAGLVFRRFKKVTKPA